MTTQLRTWVTGSRWLLAVVLVGLLTVGLTGFAAASGPDLQDPGRVDHVVIVGIAGLSWSDLDPQTTPNLWAAADRGAVGLLSTRAARPVTCPWDGWVTLGAGNRARYPAPVPEDELPPAEGDVPGPGEGDVVPAPPTEPGPDDTTAGCLAQDDAPPTTDGSQLEPAVVENDRLGFGARPGLLGDSVACTTTVGDEPVLAVGSADADVRPVDPATSAQGWNDLSGRCPLMLVDLAINKPAAPGVGVPPSALDFELGPLIDGVTASGGTLIIAGISQDRYEPATLHPVIALGPGLDGKVLSSPSTGRAAYLQLIDLAPTALSVLGVTVPPDMTGQTVTTVDRAEPIDQTVSGFVEAGEAASYHLWVSKRFFIAFAVVVVLGSLFGFLAVRRFPVLVRAATLVGTVVGLVPLSGFLANAVPWWRAGSPGPAVIAAVLGALALTSAVALLGPWRRHPSGPPLAAAAMTAGVLGVDVLTGSYLQLNSPLGYDAIVAGRFTGFGNIAFAVFGAASLACVAAATQLAGWRRRATTVVVAVLGLAVVALDGAPEVGADFGGVIALVPSLLLLWMMAARIQISLSRLAMAVLVGGLAVAAIAVLDYLRPERSRTHLGRFVGQLINGTAWTVVSRKLSANLNLLTGSVLTLVVVVLLVLIALMYFERSSAAWGYVREHTPYAAAGLSAIGLMSLIGFAVNDSGVAVTAAALAVAVPLFLSALARSLPPPRLVRDEAERAVV